MKENNLLVVGSIALDSVVTPTEVRDNILGGSAVYFSYAASYFAPVQLVGAVGEDWPARHTQLLESREVCTAGLQTIPGGKTFRWRGKYAPNMNDRETLEVHLNVLETFDPQLPDAYRDAKFVFLANGSPPVQLQVLDQISDSILTVADTMDLWIETQHDELLELLQRVDGLVINDSEARLLTEDDNMVRAGEKILALGPRFVVIKKGEHGAIVLGQDGTHVLPAFPTPNVVDPTGAGDSFAGGLMGYLASVGKVDSQTLKAAIAYGTVVASYTVEAFSLDRMRGIERADVDARLEQFRQMVRF